jgi:hypothetical protein
MLAWGKLIIASVQKAYDLLPDNCELQIACVFLAFGKEKAIAAILPEKNA